MVSTYARNITKQNTEKNKVGFQGLKIQIYYTAGTRYVEVLFVMKISVSSSFLQGSQC